MKSGLTVAPSLDLAVAQTPLKRPRVIDRRSLMICCYATGLGLVASGVAWVLTRLIGLCTNLFFFHRLSLKFVDPGDAPNWGPWVIGVPVVGGLIVGLMARYGSKAIRGHGIPEAMEQILTNESRIPWRIVFLKPLSAAISIGSGGPFGAEGPIIATGGALGSWFGQVVRTTAHERKTLLAAGAAAGMTATFGSPISAVLLAVELLLFEFKPRSLIPVALASASATTLRMVLAGTKPAFTMAALAPFAGSDIGFYAVMGLVIGVAAVVVTKMVYWVEDGFERLPLHWMWWPAIGGLAVGVIGFFFPRTLGVGYSNIDSILNGDFTPTFILIFCSMKFLSWVISLGSGTSGGTLAPLFTIGGGLGTLIGVVGQNLGLHVDLRSAALVGMAALFAGASRALLASVVFAFETTGQQLSLLPLLAGCTLSYVLSSYLMRNTIMTEKIERRGVRVPNEYAADPLESVRTEVFTRRQLQTLSVDASASDVARQFHEGVLSHQSYPVVDAEGRLAGVVTRRDVLSARGDVNLRNVIQRAPVTIFPDQSLSDAMATLSREQIGRLIIVSRSEPDRALGLITRSDIVRREW